MTSRWLLVRRMFFLQNLWLEEVQRRREKRARYVIICFSCPNITFFISSFMIPQIPRESDIPLGNLAKNENISLLHGWWECNMSKCHSEHCYISADGPHFPLSHDHFDKWASAMVRAWIYIITWSLMYTSCINMVVSRQRPWSIHQISVNSILSLHIPSSPNPRYFRHGWRQWRRKKGLNNHRLRFSILFFPTMLMVTLNLLHMILSCPSLLLFMHRCLWWAWYLEHILKDRKWTSQAFVVSMHFLT